MTFRWRRFERQVRPSIRRVVRASKQLRKQRRAARRGRFRSMELPPFLVRVILLGVIATLVMARSISPEAVVAFLAIWLTGETLCSVGRLGRSLFEASPLYVYALLPVRDDTIFDIQFRRYLRSSTWRLVELAVVASAFVVARHAPVESWLWCLGASVLTWTMVIAGGLALSVFAPFRFYTHLGFLLVLTALALALFGDWNSPALRWLAWPGSYFPGVLLVVQAASGDAAPKAPLLYGLLLGLVAWVAAPFAWRRLRAGYHLDENAFAYAHITKAAASGHAVVSAEWVEPYRLTSGDSRERVRSGEFLKGVDWSAHGVLERLIAGLLTKRERLIADYLVAGVPRWTAGLKQFLVASAIGTALAFFFPRLIAEASFLFVFILVFMFSGLAGGWNGLSLPAAPGMQSACYASLPIPFWSMALTMLKVNVVRYLCALPVLALVWFLLPVLRDHSMLVPAKLIVLGLLLQPCVILFPFSAGTNDTNRARVVLSVGCLFLLLAGAAAGFIFVPGPLSWAGGLLTLLCAVAVLGLYGRFYNRNRFDLIPLSKDRRKANL